MKNEETIKLMAETLKDSLSKYIGQINNEQTIKELNAHMLDVLHSFSRMLEVYAPLPKIEVTVRDQQASFDFYDPKTGGKINVGDWISKAIEGYYD